MLIAPYAVERARVLRAFAFDVDGVLTDGTLYFGPHGEAMKAFSVHDGEGLNRLRLAGFKLFIITGRRSTMVDHRATELKFDVVMQGVADKAAALRDATSRFGLTLEQAGFMGDDWPDLPAIEIAGLGATVPDAPDALKRACLFVASRQPGHGAVRQLCDWLLEVHGQSPDPLRRAPAYEPGTVMPSDPASPPPPDAPDASPGPADGNA